MRVLLSVGVGVTCCHRRLPLTYTTKTTFECCGTYRPSLLCLAYKTHTHVPLSLSLSLSLSFILIRNTSTIGTILHPILFVILIVSLIYRTKDKIRERERERDKVVGHVVVSQAHPSHELGVSMYCMLMPPLPLCEKLSAMQVLVQRPARLFFCEKTVRTVVLDRIRCSRR